MMQEATGRGKGGMIEKKRTTKHVVNPLLRFLQLAAACCVFPVILRSNTAGLRYNNFQAFIYLVAGSVIAAFWALMMLLMDLVLCLSGRILHSVAYNVFVALGDFIASSFMLSAGSAALAMALLNDQGIPGRPFICSGGGGIYENMCARSKTAASMAIITSAFFIPSLITYIQDVGHEMYVEEY